MGAMGANCGCNLSHTNANKYKTMKMIYTENQHNMHIISVKCGAGGNRKGSTGHTFTPMGVINIFHFFLKIQ